MTPSPIATRSAFESRRAPSLQLCLIAACTALCVSLASAARAADEPELADDRIDALVGLLVERGVISRDEAGEIIERNAAYERQRSWLDSFELYGDFRGRYEGFFFDRDALGFERPDRHRLRYRARLGARVDLGERVDLELRLASGSGNKTRNVTFGDRSDFDPDAITIDLAFLTLEPFGSDVPLPGTRALDVRFGKMPNPFKSKQGADLILWDSDLTPEGVALRWDTQPCDCFGLALDAAYYVLEEISSGADPDMFAVQLDATSRAGQAIEAGLSLSWYGYRSLNQGFFDRGSFGDAANGTLSGGNVPRVATGVVTTTGGMTRDRSVDVGDLRGWIRFTGIEDWPVLIFGNVAQNFDAVAVPFYNAGKEDLAWSIGLEAGHKRRIVHLGLAYFWVEANSVPGNFTDSDLFDGRTNGKGWFLYATREILPQVDLHAELFIADAINRGISGPTGLPAPNASFSEAVANLERLRLRGDVIVHF